MATFDLSQLETERRHAALLQYIAEARDDCLRRYASHFVGEGPQSYRGHLDPFEKRLSNCLAYTATGGKAMRGVLCADSFLTTLKQLYPGMLEDSSERPRILETSLDLAYCMEILQASFLVSDDIIDRASTRRGRPAWRKVVGDDAALLDSMTLLALSDQIALAVDQSCRAGGEIMDLYESVKRRTIYGQHLDTNLSVRGRAEQARLASKMSAAPAPSGVPEADKAAQSGSGQGASVPPSNSSSTPCIEADAATIHEIHLNKTAYYTFVLPVLMGYRAGVFYGAAVLRGVYSGSGEKLEPSASFAALQAVRPDPQLEKQLIEVGINMGLLFQLQDDYLDVFAPQYLHKEGSDIVEGKTSWVIAKALEVARAAVGGDQGAQTPISSERASELLSFITLNYGRNDLEPKVVEEVREAFRGLGIVELYREEATSLLDGCRLLVDALPQGVRGIFGPLMGQLRERCQQ